MLKSMLDTNTFISLKILEALMQKNLSEEEKAKIIAEGFAELESRYPDLKYNATKEDVSNAKLELIKEIREVEAKSAKEIKELDIKSSQEREQIRKEIKELDIKSSQEREQIRKEIKELDIKSTKERTQMKIELIKEIESSKNITLKWTFVFWATQMIALSGILYRLTQ